MAGLYATHDVVLMTGRGESFGNPIIEAHAAGRWIVSAPFEVAFELAGPLSRVAARDDSIAIGDALAEAIRNKPSDTARIAARQHASKFTADIAANRVRSALESMLGKSRYQ
jgi:hypothetical protein